MEQEQPYNESLSDLKKMKEQIEKHVDSDKKTALLKAINMKIELLEKQEINK